MNKANKLRIQPSGGLCVRPLGLTDHTLILMNSNLLLLRMLTIAIKNKGYGCKDSIYLSI